MSTGRGVIAPGGRTLKGVSMFHVLNLLMVTSAEAATVAGFDVAMNTVVGLILALCGVGVIGAIGWRGLQFVLARDYTHVMEGVIGLGVGGGMIAGARPLGTALVGTAAAFGGPLAGLTLGMA